MLGLAAQRMVEFDIVCFSSSAIQLPVASDSKINHAYLIQQQDLPIVLTSKI